MITILRAFELACNMPTNDVTNDNSNKTFQQALSSVGLAVMLSDGGHFLHEAWWYKLPYQDGSFAVTILLEVKSSSPRNVLSAATRNKLCQIARKEISEW